MDVIEVNISCHGGILLLQDHVICCVPSYLSDEEQSRCFCLGKERIGIPAFDRKVPKSFVIIN